MKDANDINLEYEKIYGVEVREALFSSDDEDYRSFRQSIVDAKRVFNHKMSLPFDGVKLLSYEDFVLNEIVKEAEQKSFRIFYIRKYVGSKLIIYGAGYYNPNDSNFYILRGSFFRQSYILYGIMAVRTKSSLLDGFIKNLRKDGITFYCKETYFLQSASFAASLFLGTKSTFREWKDDRGKTLDAYYPKYKAENIDG